MPQTTDTDPGYWKRRRAGVAAADDAAAWDAADDAFEADWKAAFTRCLVATAAAHYVGAEAKLKEMARDEADTEYRKWGTEQTPGKTAAEVWDEWCMA